MKIILQKFSLKIFENFFHIVTFLLNIIYSTDVIMSALSSKCFKISSKINSVYHFQNQRIHIDSLLWNKIK